MIWKVISCLCARLRMRFKLKTRIWIVPMTVRLHGWLLQAHLSQAVGLLVFSNGNFGVF
jgi:hypothetical protein